MALNAIRQSVANPETELRRWKRTFEANAREVNGQKCVMPLCLQSSALTSFF